LASKTKKEKKKRKNPNGFGSVYELKDGRRRKPWVARITTGWTKDGKQKRQIIGYFESSKEALQALVLHKVNPVTPKANITLGEMYKEWSESKYRRITKSTADNYRAAWNYLSKLEKAKVKDLRKAHFQKIIDANEDMSKSTLQKIKVLAVMLCDYAVENDITNKNYAQFIELPKTSKKEKETFTDAEIKKIEDNAGKVEWADTILILIYSGMRISEMLNLTRFNVDLKKRIFTGGLKTDAGKDRIIPIHDKVYKYVENWYNKKNDYLIFRDDGKKFSAKYYREKIYYPALEKLKIRKLKPHSCRHTWASLLARAKVDTFMIQKIMGHSDYAFTANEYTHTDIEQLKKAMNMVK
jgi:integrase